MIKDMMILKMMIIKLLIEPPKSYVLVFSLLTVKQQMKNMETINESGQVICKAPVELDGIQYF